ncbi:L-ascorbate oxidase [Mycena galericulata]|nr:L-ascorbate oxidase [Mycena galericulata]
MWSRKAFFLLISAFWPARAYIWPSPNDALEDSYTVSSGFGDNGIIDEVTPCSLAPAGGELLGRQNIAEWLRTAYHDMATHDVATGLGGLDGSIGFETNRPENIGSAFNETVLFFRQLQTKTSSFSDLLAMGVVLAIKNCAGPSIPFRSGRIDAAEAGPPGVPQPQESLQTHIAEFARQGFNATEMIALVACGHTIGGVHQIDFPQSIKGAITPDNPEGVVHFDNTFDVYDNHIAVQYIHNSSVDQLVVGFNNTTNSDAAIFASDGNKTMLGFAHSNDAFLERCEGLLERMLNTVPSAVKLGDVLEPLPVKPYLLSLFFNSTGGLELEGFIRIFGTSPEAAAANATDMPVRLVWKDRHGFISPKYTTTATTSSNLDSSSIFGAVQFFRVDAFIDPSAGISSFAVDYAYDAKTPLTTANNGGGGFPFQDVILFQHANSCHGNVNQNSTLNGVIRNDMGAVSSAYVEYTFSGTQQGSLAFVQNTIRAALIHTGKSTSPFYDTYTATFLANDGGNGDDESIISFDLVAVVGGITYESLNNPQIFTPC